MQFIDCLGDFYAKNVSNQDKKSLLLIQIEVSRRYDNDLLSCVRHLTVEVRKKLAAEKRLNPNAYVALIVMVPRENVRNVSGFQFGKLKLNKMI